MECLGLCKVDRALEPLSRTQVRRLWKPASTTKMDTVITALLLVGLNPLRQTVTNTSYGCQPENGATSSSWMTLCFISMNWIHTMDFKPANSFCVGLVN